MTIQAPLKVTDVDTATDGGNISIFAVDGAGVARVFVLVRSHDDPDRLPLRLYVDDVIVPIRSPLELTITGALAVAACPAECKTMVKLVVTTVVNPEYLKFVERSLQEYRPSFDDARRKLAQAKLWDAKTPAD